MYAWRYKLNEAKVFTDKDVDKEFGRKFTTDEQREKALQDAGWFDHPPTKEEVEAFNKKHPAKKPAAEKPKVPPKKPPKPKESPEKTDSSTGLEDSKKKTRMETLIDTIDKIGSDTDTENNWTNGGKPTIEALKRITGLDDITVSERNEAFEAWKETSDL